jgi:thymidylate kinase
VLIILEGPDGAGKSTLAREIAEIIGVHADVEIKHANPPRLHPIDEYEVPLLAYRPGIKHVICDRWHLGEAVYPQVLGRKTKWDAAAQQHVNLFLQSRGACVVLLIPHRHELQTRLNIRGDELLQGAGRSIASSVDAMVKMYTRIRDQATIRYIDNSESHDAFVPTPRQIIQRARRMHLAASALDPFVTYVGPPNPSVLLLGDEREPRALQRQPGMPAFVPYRATSGHYLLTHFRHKNFGIANACDEDDVVKLWDTLGQPRVVTLGRRASARVDELKIPHGSVPHPQFVRRFHHGSGATYGRLIVTAASRGSDLSSWRPS